MLYDPLFYLVAVPAVLITAISKGGFGGGLGMLAVPMMALVITPQQAAAIMLPVLCLMDAVGLWSFRARGDRHSLTTLLPAAGFGLLLGALSFHYFSTDHLRLLVGSIAITFACHFWFSPSCHQAKSPSRIRGSVWGVLAGFTSFSIHAGGPPLGAYLLPLKLPRHDFVATSLRFFAAINALKVVPYTLMGQFNTTTLLASAALAALAPVGVLMGLWLHRHISDRGFYHVSYCMLFLTGLKLLYDVIF